jgi:hypothetical protein
MLAILVAVTMLSTGLALVPIKRQVQTYWMKRLWRYKFQFQTKRKVLSVVQQLLIYRASTKICLAMVAGV